MLQVKIGPQGMERLRAFRKIANQHGFRRLRDKDSTIVAIVDSREPEQVTNPRDQKLEVIKQRCLQAAQVKYICVYPFQLLRYRELREQVRWGPPPTWSDATAARGRCGDAAMSARGRRSRLADGDNVPASATIKARSRSPSRDPPGSLDAQSFPPARGVPALLAVLLSPYAVAQQPAPQPQALDLRYTGATARIGASATTPRTS